ncbi:WG repeat-containing protein [Micromonospora sp. XM-20-01]|uniref:WG repeat-containing protein n=1 Tax=Micromonospora sp. XM-20-01 TaxID=2583240 RepID=UPI002548F796|nr:WG repeat-containing protein [Micromonospora sp. XM-20-01]
MSGWGSWREPAEPAWAAEPTHEWQPQFPGQRYPGDIGIENLTPRRRTVVGRAEVRPVSPAPDADPYPVSPAGAHPVSPAGFHPVSPAPDTDPYPVSPAGANPVSPAGFHPVSPAGPHGPHPAGPVGPAGPRDAYPVSPAGPRGTYPTSPAAPRGTYPTSPAGPRGTYPTSPAAPHGTHPTGPAGPRGAEQPGSGGPRGGGPAGPATSRGAYPAGPTDHGGQRPAGSPPDDRRGHPADGRRPWPEDRRRTGPPTPPEQRLDQRWVRPEAAPRRPSQPGWMPEPNELPHHGERRADRPHQADGRRAPVEGPPAVSEQRWGSASDARRDHSPAGRRESMPDGRRDRFPDERREPPSDGRRDHGAGRPADRRDDAVPPLERGAAGWGQPGRDGWRGTDGDGWRDPSRRPPAERREPVDGRPLADGRAPGREAAAYPETQRRAPENGPPQTEPDRYGAPRPGADQRWQGQRPPVDRSRPHQGEWPIIEPRPRPETDTRRPDERQRPPVERPAPQRYPMPPSDATRPPTVMPRPEPSRPQPDAAARPETRAPQWPVRPDERRSAPPDERRSAPPVQWPVRPAGHPPPRVADGRETAPVEPAAHTRPDDRPRVAPVRPDPVPPPATPGRSGEGSAAPRTGDTPRPAPPAPQAGVPVADAPVSGASAPAAPQADMPGAGSPASGAVTPVPPPSDAHVSRAPTSGAPTSGAQRPGGAAPTDRSEGAARPTPSQDGTAERHGPPSSDPVNAAQPARARPAPPAYSGSVPAQQTAGRPPVPTPAEQLPDVRPADSVEHPAPIAPRPVVESGAIGEPEAGPDAEAKPSDVDAGRRRESEVQAPSTSAPDADRPYADVSARPAPGTGRTETGPAVDRTGEPSERAEHPRPGATTAPPSPATDSGAEAWFRPSQPAAPAQTPEPPEILEDFGPPGGHFVPRSPADRAQPATIRTPEVAEAGSGTGSTPPATGVTTPSAASTSDATPSAPAATDISTNANTDTDTDESTSTADPAAGHLDTPDGTASGGENAGNRMPATGTSADTGSGRPATDAEPPVTVDAGQDATDSEAGGGSQTAGEPGGAGHVEEPATTPEPTGSIRADADITASPLESPGSRAEADLTSIATPQSAPAGIEPAGITIPQPQAADTPATAPGEDSDGETAPTGDPDRAPAEPAADGKPAPHTDTTTVDPEHDREPAPPEPADEPTAQTDDAPTPRTEEADTEADAEPAGPPPPPADPEQALAAVGWRLDPRTLREEAPDPAQLRLIRDGLTGKLDTTLDNRGRARLLSLRAVASRILGDLDDALGDARLAVTYAETTGELRRTALARARLAEALRWRGDHAEADRLFAETNSPELPDPLRALLHEHAGRSCYDQGRLTEACLHFERALDLRHGEDAAMNARVEVALDAVAERAAADGFGPAPRRPEEVLGAPRLPVATFDEEQQLWGYANADGEMVIAHRYAEVQPFHEGLAWVRRPEASRWALIDTSGAALIEANNGYRAVGAFSEGLSWVSMDGKGRWMAVDRMNIVRIPPGYEEVRSFRNGLAAVRQNGGWGAVDLTGEVVVPTRYHGLGTPLADGRKVDGFTADGLAVVELAGRRGVVDRAGRVVVTPAYPTVVVHPVAFMVATESGRWGALDRRGDPLIDPVHPGRAAVVAEIDRLLADASPVL